MATFEYKEHTIYYTIDGNLNGDVLVLLNGIMMSTVSWDPFMSALTKEVSVLRFDMFDQGQSTKRKKPYSQSVQVELLETLLDYLKLKDVHLAGISYGGNVALAYAAKYGHRLKSLMLFNAVAKTTPWLKAIGEGWNEVAKTRNGLAYYHMTIPMIYSPHFYNQQQVWMEERKAKLIPLFSHPGFLDAMIRLTESAESHHVTEDLPNIKIRTLIVASEYDYLTPPFEQRRLYEHMPNAELVYFNDCGHASMYEKPRLFVTSILGFIKTSDTYAI